jgi:hypothetical protein
LARTSLPAKAFLIEEARDQFVEARRKARRRLDAASLSGKALAHPHLHGDELADHEHCGRNRDEREYRNQQGREICQHLRT